MRVLTVVVALIGTPVLVAMSQDPGQAATSAVAADKCATADQQRSSNSWDSNRQAADPKGRERVGCSPAAPAPPPPSWPAGTAVIDGRVFDGDVNGLANWVVELNGTATTLEGPVPVAASMLTDASGYFAFKALPAGTYTVCEVWQDGWIQYWPGSWGTACRTGLGHTVTVSAGLIYTVFFGNYIP